jgi:hypothetical protein
VSLSWHLNDLVLYAVVVLGQRISVVCSADNTLCTQGAASVLVAIMPDWASDYPAANQAWGWMIEGVSLVVCLTREHAAGVITTLVSSPVGLETLVAHAVPYPRMHFLFPFAVDGSPLLTLPPDLQVPLRPVIPA